jgi:hypothetical protein
VAAKIADELGVTFDYLPGGSNQMALPLIGICPYLKYSNLRQSG